MWKEYLLKLYGYAAMGAQQWFENSTSIIYTDMAPRHTARNVTKVSAHFLNRKLHSNCLRLKEGDLFDRRSHVQYDPMNAVFVLEEIEMILQGTTPGQK